MKCGFYGECDVVNGSVTCVCPGSGSRPSCGDEKEPVCGSDGEIYDNLCHLMDASCQQEELIRPALPEICGKEYINVLSPSFLPLTLSPSPACFGGKVPSIYSKNVLSHT